MTTWAEQAKADIDALGAAPTANEARLVMGDYEAPDAISALVAKLAEAGGESRALLRYQVAANTQGGLPTATSWNTRLLNTEVYDDDNIVTLASNQFTLAAGTYRIKAWATSIYADHHMLRVYDTGAAAALIYGPSQFSEATGELAQLSGRVTLAAETVCELQHYFQTAIGVTGFGSPMNIGVPEIYAEVEIVKES